MQAGWPGAVAEAGAYVAIDPYRTAEGVPYRVELDREQAQEALQGSLDIEARVADAATRSLRDGLQETASAYSPFARVTEELGSTGDPTLEPSPFFTTLHGYRSQVED